MTPKPGGTQASLIGAREIICARPPRDPDDCRRDILPTSRPPSRSLKTAIPSGMPVDFLGGWLGSRAGGPKPPALTHSPSARPAGGTGESAFWVALVVPHQWPPSPEARHWWSTTSATRPAPYKKLRARRQIVRFAPIFPEPAGTFHRCRRPIRCATQTTAVGKSVSPYPSGRLPNGDRHLGRPRSLSPFGRRPKEIPRSASIFAARRRIPSGTARTPGPSPVFSTAPLTSV